MTGRISITALSSVKKKELYFKALDVLETTHNSIKLSYLTNLDKPVNSINTRNIEKMEPRVPEIGSGIDVGGLNFSNTLDFTPDVSLSGDTIIVNSINNLHISTSVKGTTSNKIILTSNCNGYFSFAGTINTGNNTSITIKSGAKVFFYNAGKINEGCRSGTVSLTIEDGAIVNFENSGTIGGVIKTSESSVVITKTEEDFDKLKYKEPSTSASVETVNGLHILSEQFTSIDSLKIFDINNKTGEITIKEPLTIEHGTGPDDCGKMIINNGCKVISNNLYFEDAGRSTGQKWGDPGSWGSLFINNGEIIVSNKTTLYINCSVSPISEYLLHENNGIIYNLGEIDGKEHLKGTGRIVELELTAEVNGELYNNITVDKVNRTVTINNLTPETDYDINLIASFEPYIERSKTIKLVTPPLPIYGVKVNESDSNPLTAVTYIEDAVGIVTATNTGLGGWANKYPFNKIRIVGFKNGQVVKEIKKEDKTKYIDGTTVPADVDVMVEIPKTYWDFTNTENGYELRISEAKFSETSDCYAHLVGGTEKDFIYVGAYLGSVEAGRLRSRSGVTPTTSITLTNFRSYANNVGSGYQQFNWFTLLLLQNLYLLAYKNLNSQNALGYGYVIRNSNKTNTGGTNTKGMVFGETGGKQQMCFLGIEDFYGNTYQWVDGMYCDGSYNTKVTPDNRTFNDNGGGFKNVGKFVNSYGGGKISKVAHTNEGGFFPKEFNGSDTTYYCDYGYARSDYFARFGGSWDYGLKAGAFDLNVDFPASISNSNLGSRLVFLG